MRIRTCLSSAWAAAVFRRSVVPSPSLPFHSFTRLLSSTNQMIPSTFSSHAINNLVPRLGYLDVHAHLFHEKIAHRVEELTTKSRDAGLDFIVVNGLEPVSNREVLKMAAEHPDLILPSVGIYPLDAANAVIVSAEDVKRAAEERELAVQNGSMTAEEAAAAAESEVVNWTHDFEKPTPFDVDAEIDWIEQQLIQRTVVALGECGMDRHYLTDEKCLDEQERVLRKLCKLSVKYDVPIILHTRKAERRVFDILRDEGVKRADFHCYCGKLNLGVEIAKAGYYLSIPSAVIVNSSFQKLVAALPVDRILTETDSPYMGPVRGVDNDPSTVAESVPFMAQLRGISVEEMREQIRSNSRALFGF